MVEAYAVDTGYTSRLLQRKLARLPQSRHCWVVFSL